VAFNTMRILISGMTRMSIMTVLGPWALGLGPSVVRGPWSVPGPASVLGPSSASDPAAWQRTQDEGPRTDQGPSPKHQGPTPKSSIHLAKNDVDRPDEGD